MNLMVRIGIVALSGILIPASPMLARGTEISAFNGAVSVFSITGPGWRPLAEGAALDEGDNIRTEAGASVELVLPSGHVVLLEEKTTAAVLPVAKDQEAAFAVFVGNVKVNGRKRAITGPFTIKTPHLNCSANKDILSFSCIGNSTKVNVMDGVVTLSDTVANTQKELRTGQSYRTAAIEYIDDTGLAIEPVVKFDLTDANCWPPRDGVSSITPLLAGNEPSIKLVMGDASGTQYNSRWIFKDKIDLDKAPYLDLWLRTHTTTPASILFLVGDDTQTFYQLPLVGLHGQYKIMDSTVSTEKEVMDGKWHRLTWNLRDMIRKNAGEDVLTIHSVIIGKWTSPDSIAELEIKALSFGTLKPGTSE
jgi:hypothetical protein